MYERFTDRARTVMQLANQEAQRFNHEYIGTEHILLGLVKEGTGVAANVLENLEIDRGKIRLEVEKLVQRGPDMVTLGKLSQTPRAKQVIVFAMEEVRSLNHNYVGTEHILLGLLRAQEGVAAQVLMNFGVKLQDVREEVLSVLGHRSEASEPTGLQHGPGAQLPQSASGSVDIGHLSSMGRLRATFIGRPFALVSVLIAVFLLRTVVALLWALPFAVLIGAALQSAAAFGIAQAAIALQNLIRFTARYGWLSGRW